MPSGSCSSHTCHWGRSDRSLTCAPTSTRRFDSSVPAAPGGMYPESCSAWSTIHGRFGMWAREEVFQTLMDAMTAEAAARDDIDLSLASVDSTVARAHQYAGMNVDPELIQDLEKAATEDKGRNDPVGEESANREDLGREQRRTVRRRRRTPLRATELARSRGGSSSKGVCGGGPHCPAHRSRTTGDAERRSWEAGVQGHCVAHGLRQMPGTAESSTKV